MKASHNSFHYDWFLPTHINMITTLINDTGLGKVPRQVIKSSFKVSYYNTFKITDTQRAQCRLCRDAVEFSSVKAKGNHYYLWTVLCRHYVLITWRV